MLMLLTILPFYARMITSKSKTKTYINNSNITLSVTLKVARAVSQSQRVVSANNFYLGGFTTRGFMNYTKKNTAGCN